MSTQGDGKDPRVRAGLTDLTQENFRPEAVREGTQRGGLQPQGQGPFVGAHPPNTHMQVHTHTHKPHHTPMQTPTHKDTLSLIHTQRHTVS